MISDIVTRIGIMQVKMVAAEVLFSLRDLDGLFKLGRARSTVP